MGEANLYLWKIRLDGSDVILLWESNDNGPDRFLFDDAGLLLAFPSESEAREIALSMGLAVASDPPAVFDLDVIREWCSSNAEIADCSALLEAWNILGDVPHDANLFSGADRRANGLYDKLFFGSNLASVTPAEEEFRPTWSRSETTELERLLLLGIAEPRSRLPRP